MEIDVGRVIAGKYRLVRLLGRGSMGEVWSAHHQSLNEHVALKLLTQPGEGDGPVEAGATAAARFRFEAQLAAKLSKKTRHIVRVSDHGEEDGLAYLVMELLEGETLDALLERERRVPLPTLSNIVGQIARALTQAHTEGVAHRDLKPANVFLSHDEDGRLLVKLLDFGIARAIHAHKAPSAFSTAKGLVFGTPSYMSPEQARASTKLDQRCDLWALATIAFEGATGEMPVNGKDTDELLRNLCAGHIAKVGQRLPELGQRLDPFFERAMAEAIDDRFQSASELAVAFARAVGAPPERAVSSPSLPELPPDDDDAMPLVRPPRSRARAALIATFAVIVTGAALGAAWHALTHPPEVAAAPALAPSAAPMPSPAIAATPSPTATETLAVPAVPVSALPQAPVRQGGWSPPPVAPAPPTPPAAPVVSAPTPAPPAPAPSVRKDRSEVF